MKKPENRNRLEVAEWLRKPIPGPLVTVQQVEHYPVPKVADRAKAAELAKEKQWADWMFRNDQAMWDLVTKDRSDTRFDFDEHYSYNGSMLFDFKPSRVSVALLRLRGKALKITRREFAAYCGISSRTVYNQERTRWELEPKKPNALYFQSIHRWGKQCYSHISEYWADIQELEKWLPLLDLSTREYFAAKAKMLNLPAGPNNQHPGIRPQKAVGLRKWRTGY